MSWDRRTDETEEWYDRFKLYLYMGPTRTVAAAHTFATRLAKGVAPGQVNSWRRAAQRYEWKARAARFDVELGRERGAAVVAHSEDEAEASAERLQMIAEMLQQVYGVLRHAELLTLSKEEARQLLPTFRLFFRDLLRFHQTEAAQFLASASQGGAGTELNADELVKFMARGGMQVILADMRRVTEGAAQESSWQPLRDVLAQLYPDEASARRMAAQAQLDSARIHFSPRAVDSWHAILTEAAHAGLLDQVVRAAQQEYGANVELGRAVRHYFLTRGAAVKVEK